MSQWGGWFRILQQPGDVDKTRPTDGQVLVWSAALNMWIPAANTVAETDPLSLHLDQSTPQTVINGIPLFQDGIKIGYANWQFKPIDASTMGLYINGVLIQSWTVAATLPASGTPLGMLMALTYA